MCKPIFYFIFGVISSILGYLFISQAPIEPCPFTISKFEGPLQLEEVLQGSKILFQNFNRTEGEYPSALRAEAFEEDAAGGFYSGLGDGRIVYLTKKGSYDSNNYPTFTMETIARTGYNSIHCGEPEFEHLCGRPLGLAIHPKRKTLFIADTLGLLELDLNTKVITTHVKDYQGSPVIFPNSIAITKEGVIYFTDSSTKHPRSRVLLDILEGCRNGRLFRYDPETKELELLLNSLYFPNGITLNPDESAIIFAEFSAARLMKYYIKGSQQGELVPFVPILPGFPDNVKYNPVSKLYWVGLNPRKLENLITLPTWVRKILSKLDMNTIMSIIPTHGLGAAIDEQGKIVHTIADSTGTVSYISEIHEISDGFLLVGSWRNDFIAVARLKK